MIRKFLLAGTVAAALAFAQAPDNTKANKGDDRPGAVTPEEQSNAKEDIELTRKIRQELTSNDTLSTYAKNVKIITREGEVVLRGPVRSADEKALVESIANKTAGASKVTSHLEVAPAK